MEVQPTYSPAHLEAGFDLSPAQCQRLNLMANGYSYQEIADSTGHALSTIKNGFSFLHSRLGVENEIQAALYWLRLGSFQMKGLDNRVNINSFSSLTQGIELLDMLVKRKGGIMQMEIAKDIGQEPSSVNERFKNMRYYVGRSTGRIVNNVALAVAYEIFRQPSILSNGFTEIVKPEDELVKDEEDQLRGCIIINKDEKSILKDIASGFTDQEIGLIYGCSPDAVRMTLNKINKNLRLRNRFETAILVRNIGWGSEPPLIQYPIRNF